MLKKFFYILFLTCFLNADCKSDLNQILSLKGVKFPMSNEKITLENVSCEGEIIVFNYVIPDNPNFKREKFRDGFQKEFFEVFGKKYCSANFDDFFEVFRDKEWLIEVRTKSRSLTFWKSFSKKRCK